MEIKTKYNIDDKIYVIIRENNAYGLGEWSICKYVYVVSEIDYTIDKFNTTLVYEIKTNPRDEIFKYEEYEMETEQNMFRTKKQAQSECDKRNEAIKIILEELK